MHITLRHLLPRSLVGRVFALYSVTLLIFVSTALGLFYRYRFALELEDVQLRAEALVTVIKPTVTDSAVIGDYDTIRRTLEHALFRSSFASASFLDLAGGMVRAEATEPIEVRPPDWLRELIASRLYDTNQPINAGGRDYGVLRLKFAADRIAGDLWVQTRYALAVAVTGLVVGLLLIRLPLVHWLGSVDRIRRFEEAMRAGREETAQVLADDAPIEFQRTFEALRQAAASMHEQRAQVASTRETALVALRGLLEGLMPQPVARQEACEDDIAAITQLISTLVAEMQQRGEQLSAIFELCPDAFVSFDGRDKVGYVSPGFTCLTGLNADEVLGLHESALCSLLGERCTPASRVCDMQVLRNATESAGAAAPSRTLIELTWPERRVLDASLRRAGAGVISQLLYLRDVTRETEVDRMKSEFLSMAAHELRTPMTSIFGFSELMLSRALTPQRQRDVVETIHRQTTLMISIVNELLDLARIEARRGQDFKLELLDLDELARAVVHDFRSPGLRAAPQLVSCADAALVRVDRNKMTQALGNVLSNAYKYSPGGGEVVVRVLRDDGGRVGVCVEDEGIGMTPEQLARVCERFYRADASGSIPGTGLGMSIVKEIVELQGGRLSLSSEPGRGTRVVLWLPEIEAASCSVNTSELEVTEVNE